MTYASSATQQITATGTGRNNPLDEERRALAEMYATIHREKFAMRMAKRDLWRVNSEIIAGIKAIGNVAKNRKVNSVVSVIGSCPTFAKLMRGQTPELSRPAKRVRLE
jgi:hypothetical protein